MARNWREKPVVPVIYALIVLAASLGTVAPARAAPEGPPFVAPQHLAVWCREGNPQCAGYIAAVADMLTARRQACFPLAATEWELAEVVGRWLAEKPGVRYVRAADAAADALARAYPCK